MTDGRPDDDSQRGAGAVGRAVGEALRRRLDAARADPEVRTPRDAAASVLRGLAGDVGEAVSDRVGAVSDRVGSVTDRVGDDVPRAAAALGGLVTGVGQDLAGAVRHELGAARSEVAASVRAGARGVGLLGAAAATGNTAVLFTGVAIWRGLGARIGYTRSAVVVAALSGAATAALASSGVAELGRVQRARRRRRPSRAQP